MFFSCWIKPTLWNFNLNEDTWINKVLFCWIAILDLWVNLKKILKYRDFLRIYKNVLEVFFIEWVWQAQTISHMYFEGFLIFTVFTEIFYSFVFDLMIAIEEVKQVWCEQKVSAAMRGFILIINWTLLSSASFQILMITKGSFALLENCYQEYTWQSWTRI